MDYKKLARSVLDGAQVSHEQAIAMLSSDDEALLNLLDGAFLVRRAKFGLGVMLHVIRNAKSGLCTENCAYCSQSSIAAASKGNGGSSPAIPQYKLQTADEMLSGAVEASRMGAVRYCVVTSGLAPTDDEIGNICEAVRRIKRKLDIAICVSLGALDSKKANLLKAAGVDRYNHNLETSPRHFPALCQSHSFADRLATARLAKEANMELCSGALLGTGETHEDRVDLAIALAGLGADAIPINLFNPRPGTPLGRNEPMGMNDALRSLAMFRFVHPFAELRIAGGREKVLGPAQGMALYPANSMFTAGYLTTEGQGYEADLALIEGLGFHVSGIAE